MKVTFIGAGNLAWHLSQALDQAGQTVGEVFSRKLQRAQELCDKLYNAKATDQLDFSKSLSSVFIIAITDDSLTELIPKIILPENAVLVHTSGSSSMDILLKSKISKIGVFYPLQTFTKSKPVSFKNTPICLEASDKATEQLLEKLAFTICENVCFYNTEDRKYLHLSAVFACNFTNHMLTIAKKIAVKNDLEFSVLHPLIKETIDKALLQGPEKSQTGPASRGDVTLLNKQMDLLGSESPFGEIYELISQSILDTYASKS